MTTVVNSCEYTVYEMTTASGIVFQQHYRDDYDDTSSNGEGTDRSTGTIYYPNANDLVVWTSYYGTDTGSKQLLPEILSKCDNPM